VPERRARGILPSNENHPMASVRNGVLGELLAESYLRSLGYNIKRVGGRGRPDLIWDMGEGVIKTIEVKTTSKDGKYRQYLKTSKVSPYRRDDDFVVIVNLETRECHLCTMEEHLKQCVRGCRRVTHLFMSQEELEILS
jgi:hypothetical protein